MSKPLIIDTFIYNGEEIVKHRLKTIAHLVDKIYIVESQYTFSGIKKPILYYNMNYNIFEPYKSKIVFIEIEEFPSMTIEWEFKSKRDYPWMQPESYNSFWNEQYQRDYVLNIIKYEYENTPYILICSDVDEIIKPTLLDQEDVEKLYIAINTTIHEPVFIEMDFYYYNWNWLKKYKWYNAVLLTDKVAKKYESLTTIRINTPKQHIIYNGGEHLSYFMEPRELSRKIQSFSHQEYNKDKFKATEWINRCITEGIDMFNRGDAV